MLSSTSFEESQYNNFCVNWGNATITFTPHNNRLGWLKSVCKKWKVKKEEISSKSSQNSEKIHSVWLAAALITSKLTFLFYCEQFCFEIGSLRLKLKRGNQTIVCLVERIGLKWVKWWWIIAKIVWTWNRSLKNKGKFWRICWRSQVVFWRFEFTYFLGKSEITDDSIAVYAVIF